MSSNLDTSVVIVDFRQEMHSNSIECANVLLSQFRKFSKSILDKCFHLIRNSSCNVSYNAYSNALNVTYRIKRLFRRESAIILTIQGSLANCTLSYNIKKSKKLAKALMSISELSASTVNCIYLYNAMQIEGSKIEEDDDDDEE